MTDWGRGHYERTAAELHPAAVRVIGAAAPQPGERVLDVACGTGNAALLAAQAGAAVSGIDAAERLVAVAREAAAAAAVAADFRAGDATALPYDDGTFDVVVSVFGVIFAQPADRAAAELTRVARPGGRILLSAWRPGGALADAGRLLREAVGAVRPAPAPATAPADWSDAATLARLFAGHRVTTGEEELAFTGDSPEAVAAALFDEHPVWLGAADVLGPATTADVRARTIATLTEANEDPGAWRSTSRWLLVRVDVA